MVTGATQAAAELIEAVCNRLRERLPADQAEACEEFTRQYYRWVPRDDLADRELDDLCGPCSVTGGSRCDVAQGETKVEITSPNQLDNGWSSPHTVLEIVSDDMPFLVDSVVMELTRGGYGTQLSIHPVIRVQRDADGVLVAVAKQGESTRGRAGRVRDARRV